jgi:hypothetical protein
MLTREEWEAIKAYIDAKDLEMSWAGHARIPSSPYAEHLRARVAAEARVEALLEPEATDDANVADMRQGNIG